MTENPNIKTSHKQCLPELARCHMACFPGSLATRLGERYVRKTLDWYLHHANRFLFHIEVDGRVVGYCGGFVPSRAGDGSSSGMLQHAFNQAVGGLLMQPWLLFHKELRPHYAFLWRNIKRKVTGKVVAATPANGQAVAFKPYCGLVVIGVLPAYQGRGIAQALMAEFENHARRLGQQKLKLSVKKNNERALKAYRRFGWHIGEEHAVTYVMEKDLKVNDAVTLSPRTP